MMKKEVDFITGVDVSADRFSITIDPWVGAEFEE